MAQPKCRDPLCPQDTIPTSHLQEGDGEPAATVNQQPPRCILHCQHLLTGWGNLPASPLGFLLLYLMQTQKKKKKVLQRLVLLIKWFGIPVTCSYLARTGECEPYRNVTVWMLFHKNLLFFTFCICNLGLSHSHFSCYRARICLKPERRV